MHRLQELVRLHRLATGARKTAQLLRMSPNTERAYREALKAAGLIEGSSTALPKLTELRDAVLKQRPVSQTAHEVSSVAQWHSTIEAFHDKGLGPKAIFDRLRQTEPDFAGTYPPVKRMCRRLRAAKGVRAEDVAIRVDTNPGEVAQIDFGYVGKLLCPTTHVPRRAWVFVMVLGYSRHMYAEVVFDQKSATWLALHRRAFEHFDGVPAVLVPDNLKSAVIRAAFSVDDDLALHRSYRELARHYGCKIDPAPPYAPKKKGKVESAVKYVKRNALAGREGEDIDDVNRALSRWVAEIAGVRTHGTTGRQPLDVFQSEEQAKLIRIPLRPFEPTVWKDAKVHKDTHISFDGRLYSVPWRWVGKRVWVQATSRTVAIFGDDTRIATHARNGKSKHVTVEAHLPEHRRDRRHRSRTYWEERAAKIGPATEALTKEIFESDDVLNELRKVQAIVTHLERFPKQRAENASKRASFYGAYTYAGVKSILAKALDLQPLPSVLISPKEEDDAPRFARNTSELIMQKLEVCDEPN